MRENILFICAHSDDHIFGAGGTIAKYSEEGKQVYVVILSYGEKTHPWLKAHITKTFRADETFKADAIVGCTSRFFDLKEGSFMTGYPNIKPELKRMLQSIRPAKIFTHNNEDPHPDHRTAYTITRDLMKTVKIKPELYIFSIWNPFSIRKSHHPRMYVDITASHQKKMKAIKRFKSQWAALSILISSIIAREIKNGLHISTRFAEQFYRVL